MSVDRQDAVLLRVLTPERVVFDAPVQWVQVPLEDGMLGVWPGHAPLIGALHGGEITVMKDGAEQALPVGPGVLLIDETHCVILYTEAVAPALDRDLDALVDEMESALQETFSLADLESIQEGER